MNVEAIFLSLVRREKGCSSTSHLHSFCSWMTWWQWAEGAATRPADFGPTRWGTSGLHWAPRPQAGDAGISQASPSALTSQHSGSGREGEKQCSPKSLTAPKLMHSLQRATHVANVSFLKCSKRSKTAAGLVFTPRLDASVNVSAGTSAPNILNEIFKIFYWTRILIQKWSYYHFKESWDSSCAEKEVRRHRD